MAETPAKTLILSSRKISSIERFFLKELHHLLPRSLQSNKVDRHRSPGLIQELLESSQSSQLIFLEKKGKVAYLWLALYPAGPSLKCLVQNLRTSEELKFDGNCSKACKGCLSFDSSFQTNTVMQVMQELLIQIFSIQNFKCPAGDTVDRVLAFTQVEGKVYFRNYQLEEDVKDLKEIGPRFVLTPLKMKKGVLNGEVIFKNGRYLKKIKEDCLDGRGKKG